VHLACAREAMKDKPWRYPWTSCSAYVEREQQEHLVDSDIVLRQFGNGRLKQSVRYLQYIKDRMKDLSADVLPIVGGVAIGREAFLDDLTAHREDPVPAPVVPLEDARRIIAEVSARHGVAEEKVMGRLQWREVSAVRQEAIHRVWKETRMGVTQLARLFQRTPSAISQLIRLREESAENLNN
jgi:hypothetical protein